MSGKVKIIVVSLVVITSISKAVSSADLPCNSKEKSGSQVLIVAVNNFVVCAGTCVTLSATATGGTEPYTYMWLPVGNSNATFTVCPVVTTTYTIVVTDAIGSSATNKAVVTVNPIPVVYFEPDTAACAPLTVTFVNLSQVNFGSAACNWRFSGGIPSGANLCFTAPVTYSTPGIYSATLTVTSNGCSSTLIRDSIISVFALPKASFSVNPQVVTSSNPTVQITNTSTGQDTCEWSFGDGTMKIGCDSVFTHTYADTGSYSICLRVCTSNNCPSYFCGQVQVVAGIREFKNGMKFSISPNPVKSEMKVLFERFVQDISIKFITVTGQVLKEQTNLAGDSFLLDIAGLAAGTYIMEVKEGENISRVKWVLMR